MHAHSLGAKVPDTPLPEPEPEPVVQEPEEEIETEPEPPKESPTKEPPKVSALRYL